MTGMLLACQTPSASATLISIMARSKPKSQKLDRTLQELETAFASWESQSAEQKTTARIPPDLESATEELKKKTKKLLLQLRQQLSELSLD